MKRSLILVVLALLFVSASAMAQTRKLAPKKAQEEERLVSMLKAKGRFAYRNPGQSPMVLPEELACAFGENHLTLNSVDLAALWGDGQKGEHDKCTTKGLMPISKRLTERFFQLLGAKDDQALAGVLNNLHNGNYIDREYLPAYLDGGQLVVADPQPDLPEMYGSSGVGVKTQEPPTSIGFRLKAILLGPVPIRYGKYAGQNIRLAITTGFVMNGGDVVQTCVNFTGETRSYASSGVAIVPTEAPASTDTRTVVAETYDVVIQKVHKDRKGHELKLSDVRDWESERFTATSAKGDKHDKLSDIPLNQNSEIVIPGVPLGETITLTEEKSAPGFKPEKSEVRLTMPTYHDGRYWYGNKALSPGDVDGHKLYIPEEFVNKKKGSFCGPVKGIYCWGPAVAAVAIFATHHGSSVEKQPQDVMKTPVPPVIRP